MNRNSNTLYALRQFSDFASKKETLQALNDTDLGAHGTVFNSLNLEGHAMLNHILLQNERNRNIRVISNSTHDSTDRLKLQAHINGSWQDIDEDTAIRRHMLTLNNTLYDESTKVPGKKGEGHMRHTKSLFNKIISDTRPEQIARVAPLARKIRKQFSHTY